MEINNMANEMESRWVADRLRSTEPAWNPNSARGRALLDEGLAPRHPRQAWLTAATAASLVLAVVAFPDARALAQDLWFRIFLHRVDIVRVDLSQLRLDTQVTSNGSHQVVQDVHQAAQIAGFQPILPSSAVLAGQPTIAVTGPISVRQTIRTRDLEAALTKLGARDVNVPSEWDGVTLRAEIGPMVEAFYEGEVSIIQIKPIEMFVPSGFPLARFAETVFRATGLSTSEAQALGRKFAANPAWLFDVPADEAVNLQEVALRSGTGLLIEDFDDRGSVARVAVIVSTPDRIFAINSGSRERSLQIANSLP
jgi:hypothetical protein